MNEKNLKNFKNLSEKERKEISSRGGKASAKKRKEAKEQKDKVKSFIESLTDSSVIVGPNLDKGGNMGLYNIFRSSKVGDKLKISAFDLLIARGLETILCESVDLQEERIKATRLLYDIKHDIDLAEERKEERQIRKELALKELALKERALSLEERKTKVKEELIRMKNREAIDGLVDPKQIENSKLNGKLKKMLIESIEET